MIDINCGFGPGLRAQPAQFGPLYDEVDLDCLLNGLSEANLAHAGIAAPRWAGGEFIDPDYALANAAIHETVQKDPKRLFGIGRVNPQLGRHGVSVAERALGEFGFRGLLVDPENEGFDLTDLGLVAPFLRLCQSHAVPLLVVTGIHPCQPMTATPAAKAFPDVPIILLRMGGYVPDDAIVAARLASNIYLETSTQSPLSVYRAISEIGSDRVIFGSGFPYADPSVETRKLARIPQIDESARAKILHKNASRLFKL
jgi:predicted TIM-barrel fold metal-dependent hydrolase